MFVVKTPEQETEMFGISVSIIDFMHLMQIYGLIYFIFVAIPCRDNFNWDIKHQIPKLYI